MTRTLPASVAARFPDVEIESLTTPLGIPLLVGRLLEEGDRGDLSWLAGQVGEGTMTGWLRARGSRRLSSRSERFWRLVLDVPRGSDEEPRPAASTVWTR